ncbi:hypothetical protein VTJ04DRAFT_828 [Mycothermus thermophilus]|uniref:uncharacterized protein n=1 Tax=Humicola insolens TaxID=85995 RepID=UPI003744034D
MADSPSSSAAEQVAVLDPEPLMSTTDSSSSAENTPTTTTAPNHPPPAPAPAPAPAAATPKSACGALSAKALVTAACRTPAALDTFLTRLNKCLETPAGIDTVLLFLCYTSKLAGVILQRLSQSALRRSAREWIALVASLPRGTTVVFSAATAAAGEGQVAVPAAAARALLLSKRLAALSTLLSEARTITRLWALLPMYFWAKGLIKKTKAALFSSTPSASSEKDATAAAAPVPGKLELLVEWARLTTCVALQALENGAYLSQRGVMGWSPQEIGKAYRWSSRFWAAFIGIELGRLAAQRVGGGEAVATAEARSKWAKTTIRQLAWAPLTLHWGSEKGLLGDGMVGLLASIPGIVQLSDLWASTA